MLYLLLQPGVSLLLCLWAPWQQHHRNIVSKLSCWFQLICCSKSQAVLRRPRVWEGPKTSCAVHIYYMNRIAGLLCLPLCLCVFSNINKKKEFFPTILTMGVISLPDFRKTFLDKAGRVTPAEEVPEERWRVCCLLVNLALSLPYASATNTSLILNLL